MSDTTARGLTFKREIGLGELVAAVLCAGAIYVFFAGRDGEARVTSTTLTQYQAVMTANSLTMQTRFDEGVRRIEGALGGIQSQISNLPDLTARFALAERQLRDGEVRDAAQDQRIDSLRQRVVEVGAEVEGLKRASAVVLPGSRR